MLPPNLHGDQHAKYFRSVFQLTNHPIELHIFHRLLVCTNNALMLKHPSALLVGLSQRDHRGSDEASHVTF